MASRLQKQEPCQSRIAKIFHYLAEEIEGPSRVRRGAPSYSEAARTASRQPGCSGNY